jgi:hypothetical protein
MSKPSSKSECANDNIVILPESDDRTLCVSVSGVLEVEDYENCFYQPLDKMVKAGKKFGLLMIYTKDYKGWSKEAADRSFQSIIEHGKFARKLGYVNPPESKIFQIKMARDLFSGEIRFFEEDQLQEAIKWIKS